MKYHKQLLVNIRPEIFVSLFMVILLLAVYLQVKGQGFVIFDDNVYVTDNPHVQSGIRKETIKWAFSLEENKPMYWHPLTWISHMLDISMYGLNPGNHHIMNLIFHVLNSVLLFYLMRAMSGEIWKSAFVALLFAIHPLNVESVAWIAARKNVLSTFFWMVTILLYIKYTDRPCARNYFLSLIAFSFGLMTKQMLITLPFVLLLLDYWPLRRLQIERNNDAFQKEIPFSKVIIEKIPFLFLALLATYIATISMKQSNIFISFASVPFYLRIENALISYVSYLFKIAWPVDLAIFYPYPESIELWRWITAGFLLLGITAIVIRYKKNKPFLLVGWFWFVGTMIPVTGIVQAGLWPARADRWTYIPNIGIFIIMTWFIPELFENRKYKKQLLTFIVFSVSIVFASQTWGQLQYWRDSFTIFEHTIKTTKQNSIIHNNLGSLYAMNGMIDKAMEHFQKAQRIDPKDKSIHYNLGRAYMIIGKIDDAISQYQTIIKMDPNDVKAIEYLVNAYSSKKNYTGCLSYLAKWIKLQPQKPTPYYYMARIYAEMRKPDEATEWLGKSVGKGFNNWEMLKNEKAFDGIRETVPFKKIVK